MRTSTSAFVLGSIIVAGLAARGALADLEAFVLSGDRVTGDLRSGGETDTYRLTGASGDVLEAVVRASQSVTVRLVDSGGSVLAQQSGKKVHLVSSALTAAGDVSIEISASSTASGKSRYTATLTCGDEVSDRRLDLREATIGAKTTSVEADVIGRDGGDVAAEHVAGIGLAGATFGSGVLRRDTPFVIGAAADLVVANATAAGPAVLFGPLPRSFRAGADVQVVLPYDPSQVQLAPQVYVAALDGTKTLVRNVTIDAANSVVRFAPTRFGVYQVFDGTSAIGPLSGASLTTSDAAAFDGMSAVALRNGRLVVGVPSHVETINGQTESYGAIYVYERSGSTWTQTAKLQPTDLSTAGEFGTAVALDGDRIVACSEGSAPTAFVFDLVGGAWTQTASIPGGFQWMTAVALDGDRLALATPMFRGSVAIYDFDGTSWNSAGTISAGPAGFGSSISLDGDRIAIGSPSDGSTGAVYTYVRVSGTWVQESHVFPLLGTQYDQFGAGVALQGTTMAVGAWARNTPTAVGSVYVYSLTSGIWAQAARIDNPNGAHNDHFGMSLALDGSRLLIGAPLSDAITTEGGMTYLAQKGSGSWTSVQAIVPSGVGVGDHVGTAVALDGTLSAVVAGGEDDAATNAGVVHVLDLTGR